MSFLTLIPAINKPLLNLGGDPDADAVINAITTAGGSLLAAEEIAVRDRVAAFKNDGLWNDLFAYYGFAGGTAAAHAINWKDPGTYAITWNGSGFTHSSTGVASDATSGTYGEIGLAPSDFDQDNFGFGCYVGAIGSINFGMFMGSVGSVSRCNIFYNSSSNDFRCQINNNLAGAIVTSSNGYVLGSRSSSTNTDLKVDSNRGSVTSTSATPSNFNFHLFGRNDNGTTGFLGDHRIQSFFFFDRVLTITEENTDAASETTYQSAMGR